jgi:hypothetical protein
VPLATDISGYRRGQCLAIKFGKKGEAWDAIYWGRDQQGTVVAHDTNGHWTLMHLDLSRFRDKVTRGDLLTDDELCAVENDLRSSSV